MGSRQTVTAGQRVFASRFKAGSVAEFAVHLPEPPQANHYYTIARNRKVLSAAGRSYKVAVEAIIRREFVHTRLPVFPEGCLAVRYVWTRGRKSGDLDNRLKSAGDSLKGLAWTDDKQVVEIHAFRRDAKGQPGLQVIVTRVTTPPEIR